MERERERAACEGKLNTLGSRQLVTRDVVQLSRLSHPLFLDSPLYSTYLLQPRSFFHSDLSPSRLLLLLSFSLSLSPRSLSLLRSRFLRPSCSHLYFLSVLRDTSRAYDGWSNVSHPPRLHLPRPPARPRM